MSVHKNVTGNFLRQNLVGLKVYFNEMIYQQGTEQKSYTFSQLMGDIGGSLGLFTGYSVIDMVEIYMKIWQHFRLFVGYLLAKGKKMIFCSSKE